MDSQQTPHVIRTVLVQLQCFLFGYTVSFTGATLKVMVEATGACGKSSMCPVGSLIASLAALCAAVSSVIIGPISDTYGRRTVLVFNTGIWIIGYILIAISTNPWILLIGRGLTGVAMGIASVLVPVYVAETSPPELRGRLGSLTNVFISAGILAVFAEGLIKLNWRITAAMAIIPALCSYFAFVFTRRLPETPRFLILVRGDLEAGRMAAKCLAGPDNIDHERALIDDVIGKQPSNNGKKKEQALTKGERKAIFAGIGVVTCFVMSGNNTLQAYLDYILLNSGVSDVAKGAACFAGTQFILAIFMYFFVIYNIGRRPLLIGSCIAASAALRAASIAANLQNGPLVVIFLCAFIAAVTLGLSTVSLLYASEVFPDRLRGRAMATSTTIFWLFSFILAEAFPFLKDHFKVTGVLDIFSLCSLFSALFCWLFVLESKDKSLSEIQDAFKKSSPISSFKIRRAFRSSPTKNKNSSSKESCGYSSTSIPPPPDEFTNLLSSSNKEEAGVLDDDDLATL
mmetsp:Transcript_21171/g.32485  ORF Transcript_21171/g.32485 Transcript_21171/m.32485 type:complete len:514 (+) Transcript_21171:140-1681(+)